MKITVFGATGGTGKHVVDQALERGIEVVAFTRSPQKLGSARQNLSVIEGSIAEADKVSAAMEGADAVISALGPTDNKAQFVVSNGMKNILAGMKQHGISRLIVTAGAGVGDPKDAPKLMNKVINMLLKTFSRNVYEDMSKVARIVRESDTNWTIVRAPMLTDDPRTGQVNAAWVGKGLGMRLARADFAAFLLDQLEDDSYIHEAPAISSEPL